MMKDELRQGEEEKGRRGQMRKTECEEVKAASEVVGREVIRFPTVHAVGFWSLHGLAKS